MQGRRFRKVVCAKRALQRVSDGSQGELTPGDGQCHTDRWLSHSNGICGGNWTPLVMLVTSSKTLLDTRRTAHARMRITNGQFCSTSCKDMTSIDDLFGFTVISTMSGKMGNVWRLVRRPFQPECVRSPLIATLAHLGTEKSLEIPVRKVKGPARMTR